MVLTYEAGADELLNTVPSKLEAKYVVVTVRVSRRPPRLWLDVSSIIDVALLLL